jgi:hypothetical protein
VAYFGTLAGLLIMSLVIDHRLYGTPRYLMVRDPKPLMQIPNELRKCVAFFVYHSEKRGRQVADGTVFFVSMWGEVETEAVFTYAVTARHCITELAPFGDIRIRVNLRAGGTKRIEIPVSDWIFHPDEKVDVAITPFDISYTFDVEALSIERAATAEVIRNEAIGIGDEIFQLGAFLSHYGRDHNIPIARIGNIAAMPEEPVMTRLGLTDAYLVETRSISGVSGSPVFVNVRGIRQDVGKEPWFRLGDTLAWLGLMHGHYPLEINEVGDSAFVEIRGESPEEPPRVRDPLHTGISIVVPVEKILETLNQPKVAEVRNQKELAFLEARKPIMD